jgi:hypothetical protein
MNQIPDVVIGALFRQIVFKICCNAEVNIRPAVTLIRGTVFGSGSGANLPPKMRIRLVATDNPRSAVARTR